MDDMRKVNRSAGLLRSACSQCREKNTLPIDGI